MGVFCGGVDFSRVEQLYWGDAEAPRIPRRRRTIRAGDGQGQARGNALVGDGPRMGHVVRARVRRAGMVGVPCRVPVLFPVRAQRQLVRVHQTVRVQEDHYGKETDVKVLACEYHSWCTAGHSVKPWVPLAVAAVPVITAAVFLTVLQIRIWRSSR